MHPFGIKNHKNHCYLNLVLQYLYSILRTPDHNWKFESNIEGQISQCLFDIAYNTSCSHGVDELKLKLSEYNAFYNDEVQQDSFECLLFLMNITNGICRLRSSSFEMTTVLYITPTNATMQELVLQDHKQKLYKTCSHWKKTLGM